MAKNDMELENEESAGKFERFLFLMIPIIFTLVLLGVLLTLFNMDIRNNVLEIANKIPVVDKWIPDPASDPSSEPTDDEAAQSEEQAASSESTIKELKAQLAAQEAQLKQANEDKTAQETRVEALQKQIDTMTEEAAAASTEETVDPYQEKVTELAKLYAGMKASKAAPIMENLTTEEMVQIFSAMNNTSKTAILEKMDPKKAAEVSVKLKETTNSTDMAIAALQSRLKQSQTDTPATSAAGNLDQDELSQTFTTMPAADAATLLGSMYTISPDKVITILNTVSDSVRSSILGEITKIDSTLSAKIVNRLMGGK
ncbi:MotE family protein [Paenibacillus pedocola]|uniref:MotE family protein n=1 Tax=Paenibacillus pedocola TaxID=3242193 RepID=UPI00287770FF|nr:kinesin [Paenibacillus typhae]